MSEIRDESNGINILSRSFPLVGCDRRAPPAKVGIDMNRNKLSIKAYANGEPNTGTYRQNLNRTYRAKL